MDPITIATGIMAFLAPYVSKAAGEVASAGAQMAADEAKSLLSRLKERWSGDKKAVDAVDDFAQKPAVYQEVLKDTLKTKLAQDGEFAAELEKLLAKKAPSIEVNITGQEMLSSTGIEAKSMRSGAIKVGVSSGTMKDSKAVVIDEIG